MFTAMSAIVCWSGKKRKHLYLWLQRTVYRVGIRTVTKRRNPKSHLLNFQRQVAGYCL